MIAPAGEGVVELVGRTGAVDGDTQSSVGFNGGLLLGGKIFRDPHLLPAAEVHPRRIEDAGDDHPSAQIRYPLQTGIADVLEGDSCDLDGSDGNESLGTVNVPQSYQNFHHAAQRLAALAAGDGLFLAGKIHEP